MTHSAEQERRLAELFSDFVDALNAGEEPDAARWADSEPELVAEFQELAQTAVLLEGVIESAPRAAEEAFGALQVSVGGQVQEHLDQRPDFLLVLLRRMGQVWGKIRWQKTVFLGAKETRAPSLLPEFYPFVAYNFGPFEEELDADTAALERYGLVDRSPPPSRRDVPGGQVAVGVYGPHVDHVYRLTTQGQRLADALIDAARQEQPELLLEIDALVEKVKRMSSDELVHHVYTRYPEYTEASLIRDEVLGLDEEDDR